MFKFGFQVDPEKGADDKDEQKSEPSNNESNQGNEKDESSTAADYPCEELTMLPERSTINPDVVNTFQPTPDCTIEYLNNLALLDETFEEDILNAESDHSDLVPGCYEGGLKVWECTFDLGQFLVKEDRKKLLGKKVLDLGCGAGILGIEAKLLGAAEVHFQDYNKDVLMKLTMVNYDINCRSQDSGKKGDSPARFFSGDWASFTEKYNDTKYDLILSSETIYNTGNYRKLLDLFDRKLARKGAVYLAAKTYYFGVGGGTRLFETEMEEDGRFRYKVVWKCSSGVKREILKIMKRDED
ncbi:histidine protein methyltransferase 1 homolog [Anopheles darlingi]|uniref:histidine protein methyltransferase 1 homolog n=1 Tax=Anopheles darlingi TaxID=43151 RepID=UPI00210036A8|nr:histidine protein methyltransferase 1 homolog [Anopheles darlingi]